MEEEIGITRSQLAAALKKWDEDASDLNWSERTDADRFRDVADYLFGLLKR